MNKLRGSAAMIAATILWGASFSAQSRGIRLVDPLLFTALRSALGALSLAAAAGLFDLRREGRASWWGSAKTAAERRTLLAGGVWCGVFLAVASTLQQYGLKYTTAAKAGFLTTLYIVIVPLLGIFFKRRTPYFLWLAALLALSGTYLLCGGIGSIGRGEWFVISCAVIFSGHILAIDRYAPRCDCVRLSCLQFAVAAVLTLAATLAKRAPWESGSLADALPYILYTGIASSAVAFTLQMTAQKYLHPVAATLLMSLESVFAALGGFIFLGQKLTLREFLGCAVIFAAAVLAQLPVPPRRKRA